jgi:DNA-binding beta-propeller fold protein YncE
MRRSFVCSIFLLMSLPAAAAPRLDAGFLEDAPFAASQSMALDGEYLYVAGESSVSGAVLAVYHLDPQTGIPTFYASHDLDPVGLWSGPVSLLASPDRQYLYAAGKTVHGRPQISVLRLPADDRLSAAQYFAADGLQEPFDHLAISPDSRFLYAAAGSSLAVCERIGVGGQLTLRQTLSGSQVRRLAVSADGTTIFAAGFDPALRSFRRGADGLLTEVQTLDEISAFGLQIDLGMDLAQSPDGRYLYLLGGGSSAAGYETAVVVFEPLAGGSLALRSRGPGTGSSEPGHRIAVNPRNGTLYLASRDDEGGENRLAAFPPKDGGSDFFGLANAAGDLHHAPYAAQSRLALAVGAGGDRVYYGSFGNRPLESWATSGEAGALAHSPSPGLGGHSGLAEMVDFSVSPAGSRVLMTSPASGRLTIGSWDGELRLESSQRPGSQLFFERVALLDENRFAALYHHTGQRRLQLFELTAEGGARPLGQPIPVVESQDLWTSPDRSQLFLSGSYSFYRFEYQADRGRLVDHYLQLGFGGRGRVRFSPDGRQVLLLYLVNRTWSTRLLTYDPASGEMALEPEDAELGSEAVDYAFSPDGKELYVLKAADSYGPMRLQARRRDELGGWSVVAQELVVAPTTGGTFRPAQLELDASGRRLAVLSNVNASLSYFERDPADGSLQPIESLPQAVRQPAYLSEAPAKIAFGPGGNELWLFDPAASRLSVSRWGCDPAAPGELCLGEGGRFRAEIDWKTASGRGAAERVVAPATDSGLFYFFDPNNWEMLVKVLDGCAINDRYWVYAAATTDVGYALRVVDTVSGQAKVYRNPLGTSSPAITDGNAFALCSDTAAERPPAGAGADPTTLLLRDRFQLEVDWSFGSQSGPARVVPFGSADSGLFYFFSDNNWEMLVKVLNGCAINGHYWLLAAATTDVGYALELRDLANPGSAPKLYRNPQGQAAPAIIDLGALACTGAGDGPV